MNTFLKTCWCITILLIAQNLIAQETAAKRVLFVGNSYTYFWNLPQHVAGFSEGQLQTAQSTAGGSNLGQHWRYEKGLTSIDKIKAGNWDMVVLQDHSRRAIDHPDSLMHFGKLLGELIHQTGAKPYVYMTWARKWDPFMQDPITKKYIELAEAINAEVVPVGLAWQKSRQLRPDLELYDEDGSHPSPLGTYLSACVFYGVLTGKSPIGLPKRIISTDKDGEKLYLNIQSENTALFCQKVAQAVLEEFEKESIKN